MNLKLDDPKFHEEIFNEIGQTIQNFYNCLSDEDTEKLDFIYAIGSSECGWTSADVFFQKDNKIISRQDLIDNSYDLQMNLLYISLEMIKNLEQIFVSYKQIVPTQIKIIYNANTEKLNYKFEYDLFFSGIEGVLPEHIHQQWVKELKNSLSKNADL